MKLWAISDIHLGYETNRVAFGQLTPRPDDWLILAGDVGETAEQLEFALQVATSRFARVVWVPGNLELWTLDEFPDDRRGEALYMARIAQCRRHNVITPEDPFPIWEGEGGPCVVAPMFLLYDYSFRPADVAPANVVAWAAQGGIAARDERSLHPDPYLTRQDWCAQRCRVTRERLEEAGTTGLSMVLVNHWPLRQDLVRIPQVPRYAPWCGTAETQDWHRQFSAKVVVSGHLHVRATDWRDGVRFEEVSLGYPRQWQTDRHVDAYLREILTGHAQPGPTVWHR